MQNVLLLFFLLFTFVNADCQDIEVYDQFDEFELAVAPDKDKIYVINYWATWCAPCIKELPYFEELNQSYDDQNIEVVLVSLDFANQRDRALLPFIQKKNLQSRLIHLTDPKTNDWIDRVDPTWSGAIPITVFAHGEKRKFIEGDLSSFKELEQRLEAFIKS